MVLLFFFFTLLAVAIFESSPLENHGAIQNKHKYNGFYVIDPSKYANRLGDDFDWALKNIPFIDFPNDEDILTAYYYRWKLYKMHIVYTPENFHVVTEFLPLVSWAGKYNTIPAAAGHHIMEGRWIHNEQYLNDYIYFWMQSPEANPSSYTNWIGYAAWQRYLLNHNKTFVLEIQSGLVDLYRNVYIQKYLKNMTHAGLNKPQQQCWWQDDGWDAMEVSISGSGCRPTMASVMYGEADTIIKLAQLSGNSTIVKEFEYWRELSRSIVLNLHWNPTIQSFAVVPIKDEAKATTTAFNETRDSCNLTQVREMVNKPVNVRELLGFMPWYYDSLIPNDLVPRFLPMWKELFVHGGFASPYGLRTAEYRHACYNYSYNHGDCWNGPSWPYETSRVLTSAAHILNKIHVNNSSFVLTRRHYWFLLRQYARQHTLTFAVNDTAVPLHSGHIFENLHPDLGYWNNRQQMYWNNDTNKNMGDDYNHSTFIDLILSGLLGIRPQGDGSIEIYPLILDSISSFAVDHVCVFGNHILSLVWDRDGSIYDYGKGLTILIDGKVAAQRNSVGLVKVNSPQVQNELQRVV